MTKLVAQLNAINIHNASNLVSRFGVKHKDDVCIVYYKREARSVRPAKAVVASPSHKTDPGAHWTDNGCMSFANNARIAVAEAVEWATKEYGIAEWVASPFHPRTDRVPKSVMDRALAFLKKNPLQVETP